MELLLRQIIEHLACSYQQHHDHIYSFNPIHIHSIIFKKLLEDITDSDPNFFTFYIIEIGEEIHFEIKRHLFGLLSHVGF